MALREILAVFGVKVETTQLEKANQKIDEFRDGLAEVAAFAGAGIGAAALVKFADHISEIGDQLDKSAIRLGISTNAVQELGFAAEQSGADAETLTMALLQLQDRVGDALTNATG